MAIAFNAQGAPHGASPTTAVAPVVVQKLITPERFEGGVTQHDPSISGEQITEESFNPNLRTVQSEDIHVPTIERSPSRFQQVPDPDPLNPHCETMVPEIVIDDEIAADAEQAKVKLLNPTRVFPSGHGDGTLQAIEDAEAEILPAFLALDAENRLIAMAFGRNARKAYGLNIEEKATECHNVYTYASSFSERVRSEDPDVENIWQNPDVAASIEQDTGYTADTINQLGSAMLLTYSRMADDIQQRGYIKEIIDENCVSPPDPVDVKNDPAGEYYRAIRAEAAAKKSDPERKAIYVKSMEDIVRQPVLQTTLSAAATYFGRLLSRPSTPDAMYAPVHVSETTASALLYNFYEQGYIELGRDKDGITYPYLTDKGNNFLKATRRVAALYFPELRHLNVNARMMWLDDDDYYEEWTMDYDDTTDYGYND